MDILLTNTPAIIFSLWLQGKVGIKQCDWLGRWGKKSISEWEVWHCHRRFGILCYMLLLLKIHFLAGFFVINQFLIPPKHWFPIFRLLLWFGLGNIAYREGY